MNVFVMFRAIWYHLYNLKSVKNPPWKSVTFSKVAGFTKSNTPLWVFFTFFNLYKWYQIAQNILYLDCDAQPRLPSCKEKSGERKRGLKSQPLCSFFVVKWKYFMTSEKEASVNVSVGLDPFSVNHAAYLSRKQQKIIDVYSIYFLVRFVLIWNDDYLVFYRR